jgi:hydrogenase expression/formation protein HypD
MKYIDEFRDKDLIVSLTGSISKAVKGNYAFMEVCGGHTSSIHRFGIPSLLPEGIRLISGPGCPVCVTSMDFIDKAVEYSKKKDVIIATFGDLLRVPGSFSSLEKEKIKGADIRIVFSGLEALNIAGSNSERTVVFLGIGFETTAPGTAVTVKRAKELGLENFLLLSAHKIMPPVLDALARDGIEIDGFICPGHVAAITGSAIFNFLPEKYNLGCVIAGFEPSDLLQSILMLVRQANDKLPVVEIQYTRAVTAEGNRIAQELLSEVFETCGAKWRGFGLIPESGLSLRKEYEDFNAEVKIPVTISSEKENQACICGNILRGSKIPEDCSLFRKICTPWNPVGACMVSAEGACNSHFRYIHYE